MKVITEALIRAELKATQPEVYYIPEGKILSPAAREYLQSMQIGIELEKNRMVGEKEKRADLAAGISADTKSSKDAIHAGDMLYIMNGRPIEAFIQKKKEADGTETEYVNYKKLRNDSKVKIVFLGNNKHKDEVFSFRFTEVGGGSNKDFMIESETTRRDVTKGRMIAPMNGGWVKIQNGVPVISRGAYTDWIAEAETSVDRRASCRERV